MVLNAIDARARGAEVRVRTTLGSARREKGLWQAKLAARDGSTSEVRARALVNAAGPWVGDVLGQVSAAPMGARVRHVKGSHIVVPRVHAENHAYILQNADKRIVFVIPYEDRYSLIGTTDVPVDDYAHPSISAEETDYLLALANAYLDKPLAKHDIVWSYSGVRPLYDDGAHDPSAITRDYVLKIDAQEAAGPGAGRAPVLSVFGGKITTYRKLAEAALAELRPFFPDMKDPWTAAARLPGGDLPQGDRAAWQGELCRRYPALDPELLRALAKRHGTRAEAILGDAKKPADLGENFGAQLTGRELSHLVRDEWAVTADDVLWRRTKCGLPMSAAQRQRVASCLETRDAPRF